MCLYVGMVLVGLQKSIINMDELCYVTTFGVLCNRSAVCVALKSAAAVNEDCRISPFADPAPFVF